MLKRGLFQILLYIKAKELKQKTTMGFSGTAFTMLLQPCLNKFLSVCVLVTGIVAQHSLCLAEHTEWY
jgi:hypothetical protein